MKVLRKMIIEYMKTNKIDGLCNPEADNCGCTIEDFAPCGEDPTYCYLAILKDDGLYIKK